MSIKAILYDMDGVLIDAREWHFASLNKALALFGLEISRYDHLTSYDGLPTRNKLRMLTVEKGLPAGLHPFINEMKQQYTMDCVYNLCRPVFQHEYALSRLQKEGYLQAVCSNAIRGTVKTMLEKAALLPYIDFYMSNEDVAKPKPDPEIYNVAIARTGCHPQECLIVEDNDHGIQAAINSGAHVLRVLGPQMVTYDSLVQAIVECEAKGTVQGGDA